MAKIDQSFANAPRQQQSNKYFQLATEREGDYYSTQLFFTKILS
jgi:hypothetical protein